MNEKSNYFPVTVLILAIGMIVFGTYNMNKVPEPKYPQFKAAFSLHTPGRTISFSELSGKVSVIFFGYTHCPDVCPATLLNFGKALRLLDADEKDLVRALFIAIDHERDTAEKVAKYTRFFHPEIIGLAGNKEELASATKAFMVPFEKGAQNAKGNYIMNHGTYLYIMRPDGELGELISHKSSPEEIVTALRKWTKWAE